MQTVAKEVKTGGKALGIINFPVFDNIDEFVAKHGMEAVLRLAHRGLRVDLERVARDAMRKEKSVKEAQALVEGYTVGTRANKPTIKNLLGLLSEFGEAGKVALMLEGQKLYKDESIEAAHTFLTEQKMKGALNK